MVSSIFEILGDIVTNFSGLLVELFTAIVSVFFTPGTDGAPGELTIIGVLTLISVGVSLVIWAFNFFRRLLRFRAR